MEDAKTTFGRRLRLIRKSRGMTLEQLGKAASIGYKHIADIERGEKVPSFEAIERFAKALKAAPYELFLSEAMANSGSGWSLKELAQDIEKNSSMAVRRCAVSMLKQIRAMEAELRGRRSR
jgi:transcriptional regulator with XRE-family HTH domain